MFGRQQAAPDAVGVDGVGADAVGAVIERILPDQGEGRGLGQPVGAEIRAGVDRLLRHVEQQTAAGPLRQHNPDSVLRDRLMREEVQLEASAQHGVIDLADTPLPGRAGVGDDDVDAAELHRDAVKCRAYRCRIGHIAGEAKRRTAELFRRRLGRFAVYVEQRHLGPGMDHRARCGESDGAGAAGHHRDLAGERLFGGLAELGLFERPVFDVEEVGLADRFEPADRLGVGHGLDRRQSEVGGDPGVPGVAAEPENTEPRHQDDPRHRVELALRHRLARVVAGEIGMVFGGETIDRLAHRGLELVETAGLAAVARSAGSSWCGSCGRGWRRRPGHSG